jgi:hypothetical protein
VTASISSLTAVAGLLSTSSALPSASDLPSWPQVESSVLSAVSSLLGTTQSDLTSQLKAGKSMNDLATAAGVSTSDLTSAIQGALTASGLPSGVNFAQMATRLAARTNNADLPDTSSSSSSSSTTASSSSTGLGVDTSSVLDVNLGGLSLDSSEVAMLLGSTGGSLDTYL